ncbi:MAG: hypothetical protein WAN86_18485 [Hyphomicrobiaceae bacterium]
MWQPPQWSIAFPITAAVMAVSALAIVWGRHVGAAWLAVIGGGVIAGLCLSIAWTLHPLLGSLVALFIFTSLLALLSAWLATPDAVLPASVVALLVASSWVLGYHVAFTGTISQPIARETESFGRGGGRRALIIFHPGRGGLQAKLQRRLAETMAGEGWRVDLVTAHRSSPTDASGYDLVILAAPTYNFRPARPLLDHLVRMISLRGKRVGLVLTGGGMTDAAMAFLRRRIQERGARVVCALEIWTARPNSERHGVDDPLEIIRRAGVELAGSADGIGTSVLAEPRRAAIG